MSTQKSMPYGKHDVESSWPNLSWRRLPNLVRLGKSGLKVSKIILGCMSYGKFRNQLVRYLTCMLTVPWYTGTPGIIPGDWALPEEVGIKHIKAA